MSTGKPKKSAHEVLASVVRAWDKLPGGRCYDPRDIESWLAGPMKRAVNQARKALAESAKK